MACGSAPPREAEAPTPEVVAEPAPSPAPAPSADTTPAAKEAETATEPAAEAKPALKGREITYRMTGTGLVVEVEGLELEPKAEAIKTAAGYDIALKVKATSKDGHMHRLLSPTNGPLMVFARVDRGGKTTDVPDERKGDNEDFIAADDSSTLERRVTTKVTPGTTVTLNVGLWGLGLDAGDRKSVNKLFFVKMTGGNKKPTPVISAPE
jgi:hypothetical protein